MFQIGEWKDVGSSPFWYDAHMQFNGNTWSKFGGDPSLMDSMTLFSNNEYNGGQLKSILTLFFFMNLLTFSLN